MTRRQRLLSAFILLILGLQAVPVVHEMTGGRETLWPFLSWGMFRQGFRPPVEADRERIFASTADGVRLVRPEDAGFDRFAFRNFYQTPIAEGDSSAARDLARRLSRRWGVPVREIAVEETDFTLDEDGLRESRSVRRFTTGAP